MKRIVSQIVIVMMMSCFAVCSYAGDLEPPSGSPASTMKTLDEIPPSWHQILPVSERFEDVMGGDAVLDKETGLVWAKDANLGGEKNWEDARKYCANLTIANRKGWRLPTVDELASLLDMSSGNPKVPVSIFTNVQTGLSVYWSNSTGMINTTEVGWAVSMNSGSVITNHSKNNTNYVWPVRGGK